MLDKLNENGGAENIYFDWWSADNYDDDDKKVDENEDQTADKNKVNTILLNLCYKVSRSALFSHLMNYFSVLCTSVIFAVTLVTCFLEFIVQNCLIGKTNQISARTPTYSTSDITCKPCISSQIWECPGIKWER